MRLSVCRPLQDLPHQDHTPTTHRLEKLCRPWPIYICRCRGELLHLLWRLRLPFPVGKTEQEAESCGLRTLLLSLPRRFWKSASLAALLPGVEPRMPPPPIRIPTTERFRSAAIPHARMPREQEPQQLTSARRSSSHRLHADTATCATTFRLVQCVPTHETVAGVAPV